MDLPKPNLIRDITCDCTCLPTKNEEHQSVLESINLGLRMLRELVRLQEDLNSRLDALLILDEEELLSQEDKSELFEKSSTSRPPSPCMDL